MGVVMEVMGGPAAAKGATPANSRGQHPTEDMCPGVDTSLRTCQGAAVNRVSLGRRLPSPAVRPGEAVSQLPCLGLPLVFQARAVEPRSSNAPSPQPPCTSPASVLQRSSASVSNAAAAYPTWER